MKVVVLVGNTLRNNELDCDASIAVNTPHMVQVVSEDTFTDLVVVEDFTDEEYDSLKLALKLVQDKGTPVVVMVDRDGQIDTRLAGIADEMNFDIDIEKEELANRISLLEQKKNGGSDLRVNITQYNGNDTVNIVVEGSNRVKITQNKGKITVKSDGESEEEFEFGTSDELEDVDDPEEDEEEPEEYCEPVKPSMWEYEPIVDQGPTAKQCDYCNSILEDFLEDCLIEEDLQEDFLETIEIEEEDTSDLDTYFEEKAEPIEIAGLDEEDEVKEDENF